MKIRHGFVSNSSSSSFIIAIPRKPETKEELHSWMFPGGQSSVDSYGDSVSTAEIVNIAFRDFSSANPMTPDQISDELSSGSVYESSFGDPKFPDYPRYSRDVSEAKQAKQWAEYEAKTKEVGEEFAKAVIDQRPDDLFIMVDYSDNDGALYSTMEHAQIFQNLPHVRISHH